MKNNILIAGETVIREGIANRITIDSNYATGGYLILTNLRIIYVITKHKEIDCIIPFSEIAYKNSDFDIFSDTPNIVKIRDKSGSFYEFSVKKGEKSLWESDIKKALFEYTKKYPLEEITLEEIIEEPTEADTLQEIVEESAEIDTLQEVVEKPEEIDTLQEAVEKPEEIDTLQEIIEEAETSIEKPIRQTGSTAEKKAETKSFAIICAVIAPIAGIFFEYGFWLFLLIGIGFCYWDESILHHSGYDTLSLPKAYLIPVYIFKRARMLKNGMEYFILWVFSFLIGIVFSFTSLSFWINLLEVLQTMITQG